ncbi:hypothetical protein ACOMHN_058442 [Nucella lapillus]
MGETATQDPNDLTQPPADSPAPRLCPQGLRWSARAGLCCPLCSAGTGAIGECAVGESGDDEDGAVSPPSNVDIHGGKDLQGKFFLNSSSSSRINHTRPIVVSECELCVEGLTYSTSQPHTGQPCRTCSRCPKHADASRPCTPTHDTVCRCPVGIYYLSGRTGLCELCDLCPAGWGILRACAGRDNTVCQKCLNGTFSDALSATAQCHPCSSCGEGQKVLRGCSATGDTECINKYMDIPPLYRFNGNAGGGEGGGSHPHDLDLAQGQLNDDENHRRQKKPGGGGRGGKGDDDDGGIDVIPLYCAALGAVVVGLLAYVAFVHYRRMRDKRMSREPHEDVEYSKASAGGADSGVFVDPDHHQQQHQHQGKYQSAVMTGSTNVRDLPPNKLKDLERTCLAGSRSPGDWKGLARELGYNSSKIASFESRAGSGSQRGDPGAPYRQVLQDWGCLEGATVAALLRALRNCGRHDVVKFLQAECAEQLQPLTATLPQNMV